MRFDGHIASWLLVLGLLLLAWLGPAQAQPVALSIPSSAGDQAGYDVAFSGDYVLVGAPFDDGVILALASALETATGPIAP